MAFGSSQVLTMGVALNFAQQHELVVRVTYGAGTQTSGTVVEYDGHGLVLANDGTVTLVRLDSVTSVTMDHVPDSGVALPAST